MPSATDLYGTGIEFPFRFDPETGGIARHSGVTLVEDDLGFLLGTRVRERVMAPGFGSRLNRALFELDTADTHALLKAFILEAFAQEPRVKAVTRLSVTTNVGNDHQVDINVEYQLIHQTDRRNLVIPLRQE